MILMETLSAIKLDILITPVIEKLKIMKFGFLQSDFNERL